MLATIFATVVTVWLSQAQHKDLAAPMDVHAASKLCYTTSHGIKVGVDRMKCPDSDAIEQQTDELITRLGVNKASFIGVDVTFTKREIKCGGVEAHGRILGCSNGAGITIVMANQTARGVRQTFAHELFHHFLSRMCDNGDGGHTAKKLWEASEAVDRKALMVSFDDIATELVRLSISEE